MDRLVKADVKELNLTFTRSQKCSSSFKLTNLMHTMSVAVFLSASNPSFTFSTPFSLLPPLSTATFTLHLPPSAHPPLSSPPANITVRSAMLPTGKASQDDLRHLFSMPGSHIFKDATIPITLIGPHVVEFLFCPGTDIYGEKHTQTYTGVRIQTKTLSGSFPFVQSSPSKTLEMAFLLSKALSGCHVADLNLLLRAAAKCGYAYFVTSLINAGADPNYRGNDSDSISILSLAIQSGDSESVRTIIENGYSLDLSDRLLHDAAETGQVDILEILCLGFKEIDRDLTDSQGRTALHIAAINGNFKTLSFLISIGCNPDLEDLKGWTPLHYSSSKGCIESAELLVNSSTYAKHILSKDGYTPFSLAIENNHSDLKDMLNLGDALHRAARVGDVSEIKTCLENGAKVDSRDQNGWTPLHRAAFKGRIECVKVLLSSGAPVDAVEDGGRTALHLAAEAGHLQVVLCLKAYGAKANGKTVKGFDLGCFGLDCFTNHPLLIASLCQ